MVKEVSLDDILGVQRCSILCALRILFGKQDNTKDKTLCLSSPVSDWSHPSKNVTRHISEHSIHHANTHATEEFLRTGAKLCRMPVEC